MKTEIWYGYPIRFAEKDGEWWAVAKDVTDALGLIQSTRAVSSLKGVTKSKVLTDGGQQVVNIINEKDIYRLVFKSRKPEAEQFQDWVFDMLRELRRSTGLGRCSEGIAMIEKSAEDKVSECCRNIRQEIEHWKDINQNGCSDAFWSDGCNMNLTRNHIIYYQSKIREACTENQLPLPEECYLSIPPEVDNHYMANFKQKPRVERLRQTGRIMTGYVYQYDENQMSLF